MVTHEVAPSTDGPGSEWITTVVISGVPPQYTPPAFKEQLDEWGLLGCYDLFLMPADKDTNCNFGYALVNFIDPAFTLLCQWVLTTCQFPGGCAPSQTQGVEACIELAGVYAADDHVSASAAVVSNPIPSQWAVNATNELLSPQYRDQFRKTKLCSFFRRGRCTMGGDCLFAHSTEELQEPPNLSHTKLCYNHFRGRCTDPDCRYAHGSRMLRTIKAFEHESATWGYEHVPMCHQSTEWSAADDGDPQLPAEALLPESLLNVLNHLEGEEVAEGADSLDLELTRLFGGVRLTP